MPAVHFLGTGSAITDPHRTTTMLAFQHPGSVIVIDCGGDLVQRLLQAGLPLDDISALIITHAHPDHVAGFPLAVQKLWLARRRTPLPVHGIAPALDQARRCLGAFDTSGWNGLFAMDWREFPHTPGAPVLDAAPWRITAMPSNHSIPSVALRIEHAPSGRVCAYSSDTAPFDAMADFARGADLLVHEASGPFPGHSTALDAARIAAAANVRALRLVHLAPESQLNAACMAAARQIFPDTQKAGECEFLNY